MHTLIEPSNLRKFLRDLQFTGKQTGTTSDWFMKSSNHWLNVCRGLMGTYGRVKMAELGGGQDTPFEQAFSNLAHSYIKDKAPKLLDYEVGFQLLEKNQDNTKSVGVFGFKIGNMWVYVPVFFLNGDLKGHELMYIKQQDQFLPLKENWITKLLGRKPAALGGGVNRNLSMLGIMPPNLYQLSKTPQKFASDQSLLPNIKMATWAIDFMPTLGYLVTTEPGSWTKYASVKGTKDLLADLGPLGFRTVVEKVGREYPMVFSNIDKLFGPEMLDEVAGSFKKKSALSTAGDPLPKNWDGGATPPTKKNGGITSFGPEAWNSSQIERRFKKKHGGAQIGKVSDAYKPDCCDASGHKMKHDEDYDYDVDKRANYPGCGMKPRRQKKKKNMVKKSSIISSVLGPVMAQDTKHKVISKEMVKLDPNIIHDLKSDEREKLLKERVVLTDKREHKDVTVAYDVQTPLRLTNPDHTGIYHVLVKPDTFEKCLVILGPYSHQRRHNWATVVCLEGKKDYTNTHPANVWVSGEYDIEAFKAWLKDQKDCESVPVSEKGKSCYVLLGPTGQGSLPFRAINEYKGGNSSSITYDVKFEDHNYYHRPAYLPDHGESNRDPYLQGFDVMFGEHNHPAYLLDHGTPNRDPHLVFDNTGPAQVILTKRPGIKMTCKQNILMVPDNFKIIKVQDEDDEQASNSKPLQLGSLIDAQLLVMANTQPMRIVSDGKDVTVNENRMDKTSALVHLFLDHGLSEKVARHLIDKAKFRTVECRLVYPDYIQNEWEKTAADPGNDMIRGAPNAPPFPEPYIGYDPMTGGNVPTMQESEFNVKIPDMSASKTDRSQYYPFGPDPKAMQVAQQAAQTGQREVFDTAMLGSLLKAVRQDNIVDKYMGDLMKGLDRLGRILFLYYWHGEEFEDRYGKQDMPELEDGLRNAFEGVGDIVLTLQRKSVEPFPDEGTDVDLGPVANQ